MIRRYSGLLTIEITLTSSRDLYCVSVRGAHKVWRSSIRLSVDATDKAYDQVAQAALEALDREEERGITDVDLVQHADWDIDGPFVARVRLEAA